MSHLFRLFFKYAFLPWIYLNYRLRRFGTHHFPEYGGVLLIPNHVTYIDSFFIYLACPRPVRFIVAEHFTRVGSFGWFLRLFRNIPIDQSNPRQAIKAAVEALHQGDVVCLFAEGGLTRSGLMNDLKKGLQVIARRSGCPVIPCYMDGPFYSIFSFERGTTIRKWPRRMPCPVQVVFGPPIPPEEATVTRVFQGILDASVEAFAARRTFEPNLESVIVRALKKKKGRVLSCERGKTERCWKRFETLGLAMAIARRWINSPPDDRDRIGILLPPGPTPAILNLGLFLAGKTPVNLPFGLSPSEVEKLARRMEDSDIRTVITSKVFMPHLVDFWRGDEGRFIDVSSEMTAPGPVTLSLERFFARFEPVWLTEWRLELKERNRNREAVGLVVSLDDDPVFLTSGQLHENAGRVIAGDYIRSGDRIFSELPLSTAAGHLFQIWVPILNQGLVVGRSFSRRKDERLLRELAEEKEVDIIAGDLPFFEAVDGELDFPGLRFGLLFDEDAGAVDIGIREELLKIPLLPCWEFAGRVVTISLPPESGRPDHHLPQMCRERGSVGRFLPGIGVSTREDGLYLRFDSLQWTPEMQDEEDRPEPDWIHVGEEPWIDELGFLFLGEKAGEEEAEETRERKSEVEG